MAVDGEYNSRLSLDTLPDIALENILSFLGHKDLASCCLTCKRLNQAVDAEFIWKRRCRVDWLQTRCPTFETDWKSHFRYFYRQFGRYIHVYQVIRRAWDKIEKFAQHHCPALFSDLNDGATDDDLDMLERKHKVKYPDDLRCSFRIHNGQQSAGNSMAPGLLGTLSVYHIFINEVLCPISGINIDHHEKFADLHVLSYCWWTKTSQVIALSDSGGHTPGQVFYQVSDMAVLHSWDKVFVDDKFIVAESFTKWLCTHADNLEKKMYPIVEGYIYKFYQEPGCEEITEHIRVRVGTAFMPGMSTIHRPDFAYAYRITLEMPKDAPVEASCQLTTRHWEISQDEGEVENVDGPGVVGEFPVMRPGSSFTWVSSTSFQSTHGYMSGHFMMRNLRSGELVRVICPTFHMRCLPYQTWEERKDIVLRQKKQQDRQGTLYTKDVVALNTEKIRKSILMDTDSEEGDEGLSS